MGHFFKDIDNEKDINNINNEKEINTILIDDENEEEEKKEKEENKEKEEMEDKDDNDKKEENKEKGKDIKISEINQKEILDLFMTALVLCHSGVIEEKEFVSKKKLIFRASSPDEVAILNFARKYKYIFLGRQDNNIITLKKPKNNELIDIVYKIPILFEYSSERKSMSVIVQNKSNPEEIFLFMKGADNIILQKLDENNNINKLIKPNLKDSLEKYAKEGLRILAVAYKKITLEELYQYQKEYIKAFKNTYKKKEKLEELAQTIEKNLILLGVTAIEDELQDDVNETLKDFSDAGIKLWVLTGDKKDTAKSIAYSCGLFDDEKFNIFEINEGLNKIQLESRLNELVELYNNIVDKINKLNKGKDKQKKIIQKSNNNDININENNSNNINDINSTLKKITNSLIGLQNLGNTCYMNTCLQNLIHCKPLIKGLLSNKKVKKKKISNSFLNLCLNISISYKSYSPNDFRNTFCSKHIQYSNYGQHDTVELLRTLLDDISKELNTNEIISKYKELKTENKSKVEQNNEYHEWYLTRENSIIINVFYAQIINTFTCECGYESYSFEKILDIPLLLPNNRNNDKLNLGNLLFNYFSGEKFKWDSKCEKCLKKNLYHSKKILFSKLPKILVFSIQRYNYLSFGKSNKSVEFYDEIDLKNFIDNDLEINNNTKYKLFGISNHSGTLNFGHYYSYTKVNNCWFEFNDAFVSSKNISYNSTNVYALFYEQIID